MKRKEWKRLAGPAIAATCRHTSGWTVTRKYSPDWSAAWPWVIESPDGRLFVAFRDTNRQSPTNGDWFGWVGTFDDLVQGRPGQYRVRLRHNTKGWDCGYTGVEVQPDGTFIATTYGHWTKGEMPYIVTVRFTLAELDAKARRLPGAAQP